MALGNSTGSISIYRLYDLVANKLKVSSNLSFREELMAWPTFMNSTSSEGKDMFENNVFLPVLNDDVNDLVPDEFGVDCFISQGTSTLPLLSIHSSYH